MYGYNENAQMFNIGLPQYHQVLDHFLAKVVINAVYFFFRE